MAASSTACRSWARDGLTGQRIPLRFITDSGVWRVGMRDVFETATNDGMDDLVSVWMYANPDIEDGTVERHSGSRIIRTINV
jgi:hypothetical protein